MKKIIPVFLIANLLANIDALAQTNNTLLDSTFMLCSQVSSPFQPFFTGIPAPGIQSRANKVLVQNDDKIMVAGPFRATINGQARFSLFRLNSDGSYDTSFNFFGNPVAQLQAATKVVQLPNGKYLVSGSFMTVVGQDIYKGLYRLNADGSEDTSFASTIISGVAINNKPCIYDFEVLPNGKILIGGDFINYGNDSIPHIALLNENGTLDNSFTSPYTPSSSSIIYDVLINGNTILAGSSSSFNVRILNMNGGIDTASWISLGNTSLGDHVSILLNNGKILIGGGITNSPGEEVIRLNANYSFDSTFNIVTTSNFGEIHNIHEYPNGKILVVGDFDVINGGSYPKMVRLNEDGTVDNTFQFGTGAFVGGVGGGGNIYDVDVQSDGKIVFIHNIGSHYGTSLSSNGSRCIVNRLVGDNIISNPNIPNPPSNLTAVSTNSIVLNWQDNSNNEDGFYIETASSANGPWQMLDSVNQNINTYTDTGLTVGVEYFYRVSAYNSFGTSTFSNIASAVELPVGISSRTLEMTAVFPNPTKNSFQIQGLPPHTKVLIINAAGVAVYKELITEQPSISVSNLPKGMYFCHLANEQSVVIKRVIVQ